MSTDDRKSQQDVSNQEDDKDLQDLRAKKIDEQDADKVKGGVTPSDFHFTKVMDKSSPIL